MGLIVKIADKYFEWSSICDAPRTFAMTLEELHEYIKAEYGESGLRDLPARLERVEKTGVSSCISNLESTISVNRAGPKESCLTADEILKHYADHENYRKMRSL